MVSSFSRSTLLFVRYLPCIVVLNDILTCASDVVPVIFYFIIPFQHFIAFFL